MIHFDAGCCNQRREQKIYKSIIAQDAVVGENCTIGVGEYADSQYNKKVYCCDLVTVARRLRNSGWRYNWKERSNCRKDRY